MRPLTPFAPQMRETDPMGATPGTAHPTIAVARLHEEARCVADRVVARALAARRLGATAASCRLGASELEGQAGRAESLLFGRAVETFRAAAAESRLVADALDAIEGWAGSRA